MTLERCSAALDPVPQPHLTTPLFLFRIGMSVQLIDHCSGTCRSCSGRLSPAQLRGSADTRSCPLATAIARASSMSLFS